MAKKAGVDIKIDTAKFVRVLADTLAQGVATNIRILAKKFVAVDSRDLQNSIRVEGLGMNQYEVLAGGVLGVKNDKMVAYALAQEFGRPDLDKYTFTPYMRPAAQQAIQAEEINKVLKSAVDAALMQAAA